MIESFNPFDLFVLVVLVLSTFWGGMRGIISQLASILSWLASAYIATHYYQIALALIKSSYAYRTPIAMTLTFIVSAILIRIAAKFVKNIVSLVGLKEFDRQMGALLGMIKGLLLCLLSTFFLVVFNDSTRSVIEKSSVGPYFASFIVDVQGYFPESELTQKFASYTQSINEGKAYAEEEEGVRPKSIETEVNDLRNYLVSKVFSPEAGNIVENPEESKNENSQESNGASLFQSATSSLNKIKSVFTSQDSGKIATLSSAPESTLATIASSGSSARETVSADETNSSSTNASNRAAKSDGALNELATFLASIGGGFSGYSGASTTGASDTIATGLTADESYQSPNRSSYSRSSDSEASRTRLNSRTYTIE